VHIEAILVVCVLFVFHCDGLQTKTGLVQGGVILAYLCVSIVLVKINTIIAFVVDDAEQSEFVTSRAEWAGFFACTITSSMVVPATCKTSVYNYIIFRVTDMPAYFQFCVEYLLSCLRTNFSHEVLVFLLPLNMNFGFTSPAFRFSSGFWVGIISSAFSAVTSSGTL
jgi:hypothetical protein